MSLWYTSPEYETDAPCTHVLIFGTSAYSGLPDRTASSNPDLLGLTSVTTPAISAYRFARWIKDEYQNKQAPLGSIRLLLAPSASEIQNEPALDQLGQPLPTKDNIEQALVAWREDCCKHRDGCAILYGAGHGVRISSDSGIVLLEDFGKVGTNVLSGAVDIGNIHQAMALNRAAKNQFYFVDACAIEPTFFKDYITAKAGVSLDVKRGESVEGSPIFFSAAPETLALGEPGKGTLFIQALIQCLECDAAVADDANDPKTWLVYTQELFKKLRQRVDEIAGSYGENQSVVLGGLSADSLFHQLRNPPQVQLSVSVVPENADRYAHYKLTHLPTSTIVDEQKPFQTPRTTHVTPGVYKVDFTMQPGCDYGNGSKPALIVSPPSAKTEVQL